MKRSTAFSLILTLGFHLLIASPPVLSQKPNTEGPDAKQSILVKVYYFHTSYRCANCKKFEKWSKETVDEYFKDETEKGLVAYEKMNIEEKENKHVVEDYRLVTKSIILSKIVDGEENTWKNLDKIWTLLSDEVKFKEYVRDEIKALLEDETS